MGTKDLGDYAYKLCNTSTYEESFLLYSQYINNLGYESSLYSFIPDIVLDKKSTLDPVFSVSKYYQHEYLDQYTQSRFDKTDYVIKKIKKGNTEPMDWWEDCKNGILNTQQIKILNIMRDDYQIRNGLSIPLLSGVRGIAAASVMSNEEDRLFTKLKTETHDRLWTATKLFHNHVVSNAYEHRAFITPVFSSLQKTEKQVLKCILEGLSVPDTSKRVFKSRRYTENLVRNIRIKIGGETSDGKPRISKDLLIHFCGLMQIYDEL